MSPLAEVLLVSGEETILVVSEPQVKMGTIPHESVTLEEGEEVLLFSDALPET